MSNAKTFAQQTAVYGLSTIAARVINYLLTPIYTRAFSTKVYGIFGSMYSYASMVNALLAFGMETTFFRYCNKTTADKDVVYNNAFAVVLATTLVFLALSFPMASLITRWIQIDPKTPFSEYLKYTRYFIGILIVDAWCVIPFAKIRANGRPGRYGTIKLLNIAVYVGLNLTFIYLLPAAIKFKWFNELALSWFKPGWLGYVFLSNLIASSVTLLLLLPEILQLRPKLNSKLMIDMLLYSWPVLIANFSFLINENLDKILLGWLLPSKSSATQVGIYVACAKLSIFLSIFVNAFRLGAEPFFFNHAKNSNARQTYARVMTYFVIAVCLIFVALVANLDLLKYFIKGKDPAQTSLYWSGLQVVPILLFGYVSLGIYMNLSVWYKLSDQTKYGLYISGAGALVTIILNLIFIPRYSYIASAWISLLAYALMMILSYFWGQRNYPIPYQLGKITAYILVSIVLAFLCFKSFHRNIIVGNFLLGIFALGALLSERKELKRMLKF